MSRHKAEFSIETSPVLARSF